MFKGSVGCCLGIIGGFLLVLAVIAAAGFGVYYYFNEDARYEKVDEVDKSWSELKDSVDSTLDRAKRPVVKEPKID
ncbi:MAG: hypothetical protein PHI35_02135 [Victivallaceae bacterium]|nr:hypothetical protein [Victivallaceae bacterium]